MLIAMKWIRTYAIRLQLRFQMRQKTLWCENEGDLFQTMTVKNYQIILSKKKFIAFDTITFKEWILKNRFVWAMQKQLNRSLNSILKRKDQSAGNRDLLIIVYICELRAIKKRRKKTKQGVEMSKIVQWMRVNISFDIYEHQFMV